MVLADVKTVVTTATTETTTSGAEMTGSGQSAAESAQSALDLALKTDDAMKAAIAKAVADAQAPTAQVQIAVATIGPKPGVLTPDAASAVAVAALAGAPEADGKSEETTSAPSSPEGATPLHAGRHDGALRVEPVLADANLGQDASVVETKTLAEADATSAPAKAKSAPVDAATTDASAPSRADNMIPSATTREMHAQSAAADHNPPLSTLSRATVETTAHLAAQIARRLDGRSTRFDMVLTPEDLGRVDVSLEIGKDGQLSARLAFDNPAAAADLRGRADELRRQLQDAGFQVSGDALDFSQRDPSAGGGGFARQQRHAAPFDGAARLASEADALSVPAPGAWTILSQTPDRVDLKV